MKNNKLFFIAFLVLLVLDCNAANSSDAFKNAKKMALASNKLILIDFTAAWCGPCKRMESESWSDTDVKNLMSNFIFLKIDIDYNKDLAMKYDVKGIPYVFILDPNGEVLYNNIGYQAKSDIIKLLTKYSLNLEYLQAENINFFKNKSSDTAIKLAEKYMDFTLFFEDQHLKSDFKILAKKYLKISEKLAKKEKVTKNKITQRSKLLALYSKLLSGKYDKVIEKLEGHFKESDLIVENNSLYDFLYFVSYKKLLDKPKAKIWYEKLRKNDDYLRYLKKYQKL